MVKVLTMDLLLYYKHTISKQLASTFIGVLREREKENDYKKSVEKKDKIHRKQNLL